jgi:hypothetical protein
MGIGQSLLFRSWIGIGITVLAMAVVLFRIHDEEALMYREFGGEWEAYCRQSIDVQKTFWTVLYSQETLTLFRSLSDKL